MNFLKAQKTKVKMQSNFNFTDASIILYSQQYYDKPVDSVQLQVEKYFILVKQLLTRQQLNDRYFEHYIKELIIYILIVQLGYNHVVTAKKYKIYPGYAAKICRLWHEYFLFNKNHDHFIAVTDKEYYMHLVLECLEIVNLMTNEQE
jgi:hypothetical protein